MLSLYSGGHVHTIPFHHHVSYSASEYATIGQSFSYHHRKVYFSTQLFLFEIKFWKKKL